MAKNGLITRRDLALPGMTLTATGIVFDGDVSAEDWEKAGEQFARYEGGLNWWIGDWLLYGEGRPKWGDKYESAVEMFGQDIGRLQDAKSLAKEFEFSRRRENLSWSFHKEVWGLEEPDQEELLDEAVETGWKQKDLRTAVRKRRRCIADESTPPPPKGKFNLVLADPPWQYDYSKSDSRKIENQYPTMELEDICALEVPTHDDCVLFLWATSPKLTEAMEVVTSWGFTYRTCMVWRKDKIGMGYYARQQHELLLICTTGSPRSPEESTRPASVVDAPREEHSRKPEVFYELIESMYPKAKKVEMFCREPRKGWKAWGNQV